MTDNNRSDKIRALFLAFVMVVSIFGAGIAFAGSAAAADSSTIYVDDDYSTSNSTHKQILQYAIDNATSGDTVVVQEGTYNRFTRVQTDNLVIKAAEGTTPIIKVDSGDGLPSSNRIIDIGAQNVTFTGFEIVGPGSDSGAIGIHLGIKDRSDNITVSEVEVHNVLTGIQTSTTTNATIRDSIVSSAQVGISLQADNATVQSNTLEEISGDWEGIGITGADHVIKNNDISTASGVPSVRIYNEDVPTINDVSGTEEKVADAIRDNNTAPSVEFETSGNTYDGSVTIDGVAYASIQQAIDKASSGDIVEVAPGIYQEKAENRDAYGTDNQPYSFGLYVGTDNITIQGVNDDGEVITETGNVEAEIVSQSSSAFGTNGPFIAADNVTIQGLEISPNSGSPNKNLEVAGDNFTLSDSVVNGKIGSVYFNTGDVQNLTVTDSEINGSLSFNNGVGNKTEASNRVVKNNEIGLVSFAGAQDDVNWRNYDVGPVTLEGNTIEGHHYELTYTDSDGNEQTFVYEGVVRRVGTVTEPMDWASIAQKNTLERGVVIPDDSTPTGLKDTSDASDRYEIYYSIQNAVDDATDGDRVEIASGTYDESVAISTKNITLHGVGDPVIDGRVDVKSDLVTIADLTVRHGAPSGSNEVEGIFVGNANGFTNADGPIVIDNVTVEDVHPHGTEKTLEGIHVKHYNSGSAIDGVHIVDVTVENVTGPAEAGANGVKIQAGIKNVSIVQSNFSDIEGSWSYGVVATPSSQEDGVPERVGIFKNSFEDVTATNYDGVAVGIDGKGDEYTSENYANPREVFLRGNAFTNNDVDILNKNRSAPLDATLNWFGETGPDDGKIAGVEYDPFLSTHPDEIEADNVGEITDYAHDIVIPNDGNLYTIAFPAPVDGTVSEVFGDVDGNVFAYDGNEWKTGDEIADEEIDALDAFLVSVDSESDEMRLTFEYEQDDSVTPTMTTNELEAGWNFVGAPQADSSADAFSASTAPVERVVNPAHDHADRIPYDMYGSHELVNPDMVSPFQGYWVFSTEDGEIGATLPVDPDVRTESESLDQRR